MTARGQLAVRVAVDAPAQVVWDAVTDWPRQSDWMLATTVELLSGDGRSPGSRVVAVTGVAGVGVRDTMTVTAWEPPHRVRVLHDGRLLRGPGLIEVRPRDGGSELTWSEDLALPFGVAGRLGWPLVRPAVRWGFRRSLRRFARSVAGREADRA